MSDAMEASERELVVHLFAPLDGPRAGAAYGELAGLWRRAREAFGMGGFLPGTGLPNLMPATLAEVPEVAEAVLAAQRSRDADAQAVLRRHHDVLNLSVALAPGLRGTDATWSELEARWDAVAGPPSGDLLGEARLRLGKTPEAAEDGQGVLLPPDVLLRERTPPSDTQAVRRMTLLALVDRDRELGAWAWSNGSTAIPPLARYLLHAAKVRYQRRVRERDRHVMELHGRIEKLVAGLRPGRPGDVPDGLSAALRQAELDAVVAVTSLREMRRTVLIARDNLVRCTPDGLAEGPPVGNPFRQDLDLADWCATALDDDAEYLDAAQERARRAGEIHARTPPPREAPATVRGSSRAALRAADPRGVFVVHGRDLAVRDDMFAFLRALGLRPLEWEPLVVAAGSAAPFVADIVARGIDEAQAVVVLLTPDERVGLLPALNPHNEQDVSGLQARPNVLVELGMALALKRDRTVIVHVGRMRPINDLGGFNYVQLNGSPVSREKLRARLEAAGCEISGGGTDWLSPTLFTGLDAPRYLGLSDVDPPDGVPE